MAADHCGHQWSSLSRRHRRFERWQGRFDLAPVWLEPRRQHELLAQMLERFVSGEARTFRRQLEQHSPRLEEIDRLEPEAVDDFGRATIRTRDSLANFQLDALIRHA